MNSPAAETPSGDMSASYFPDRQGKRGPALQFPFRQNTIARKAQSPGPSELEYQLRNQQGAAVDPQFAALAEEGRRDSGESVRTVESDGGLPAGHTREIMGERIEQEQMMAKDEEEAEMERVEEESPSASLMLGPTLGSAGAQSQSQSLEVGQSQVYPARSPGVHSSEENVAAALREADGGEEVIEDQMEPNQQEKKRVRREKLGERLQEVFGLEEREEVLEEMRCWLLRSVSEWSERRFSFQLTASAQGLLVPDSATHLFLRQDASQRGQVPGPHCLLTLTSRI